MGKLESLCSKGAQAFLLSAGFANLPTSPMEDCRGLTCRECPAERNTRQVENALRLRVSTAKKCR